RVRIAEIGEDAVAHVLSDATAGALDHLRARRLILAQHDAQILGVHPPRQLARPGEVGEHDRQLAPLTVEYRVRSRRQASAAFVAELRARPALVLARLAPHPPVSG